MGFVITILLVLIVAGNFPGILQLLSIPFLPVFFFKNGKVAIKEGKQKDGILWYIAMSLFLLLYLILIVIIVCV
jgi:hypothetical protein